MPAEHYFSHKKWIIVVAALASFSLGSCQGGLPTSVPATPAIAGSSAPSPLPAATATPLPYPSSPAALIVSATPVPTLTQTPAFIPLSQRATSIALATPSSDRQHYRLAAWTDQDALDLVAALDMQAAQIESEIITRPDALNPLRVNVALLDEEILWQRPQLENREKIEWGIAQNYAQAGDQKATDLLVRLLGQKLNQVQPADPTTLQNPPDTDFVFSWYAAANLFSDDQAGWILGVTRDVVAGNPGGAVLAIRGTLNGRYTVEPVYTYWMPYFGSSFSLDVADHNEDRVPEVTIRQSQVHGMGESMAESWMCAYQWRSSHWSPLFSGMRGDDAYYWDMDGQVDPGILPNCILVKGFLNIPEYIDSQGTNVAQTILTRLVRPGEVCPWKFKHLFTWTGDEYRESAQFELPVALQDPLHMVCFDETWEWIDLLDDRSGLIRLMQDTVDHWPEPVEIGNINGKLFGDHFGPDYHDEFRFQLGRLFAYAGDLSKARQALQDLADHPTASESVKWPDLARKYLSNLASLHHADTLLHPVEPTSTPKPIILANAGDIVDQYSVALLRGDPMDGIVKGLEKAANDPALRSIRDERCSAIDSSGEPDPITLIQSNQCAGVYFLLGMSYERDGEPDKARDTYWQIWKDYPLTFYANAAMRKLVYSPG